MDHPRSRGVYRGDGTIAGPAEGSSPLARGLRGRCGAYAPQYRIIPARAGFTSWPRSRPVWPADHPRSRGVYYSARIIIRADDGSSPLARGLRLPDRLTEHEPGIIPARAGFTHDHHHHHHCHAGSSPLARGLRVLCLCFVRTFGIIPARAGFTFVRSRASRSSRDHPRSRGVYVGRGRGWPGWEGSSPLARGLRRAQGRAPRQGRIIPARAGFTCPAGPARRWPRDHPRSRGVYASS